MKKICIQALLILLVFVTTSVATVRVLADTTLNSPATNLSATLTGTTNSAGNAFSGSASAGEVTFKVSSLRSAMNGTLTLTNTGDKTALLSFSYTVSGGYSSCKIAGGSVSGSGTYSIELAAGGSVKIYLVANTWTSLNPAKVVLTNVQLVVVSAANLTVSHNASGTVSVGGNTTASGTTIDVEASGTTLVATPGAGASFLAWVNTADNSVYSTSASLSYVPTGDASLKAIFAHADKEACFWGSSKSYLFEGLPDAIAHATSASNKTIILAANGTLPSGNYTIPSGVTLLIPFDSNSTCYTTSPGYVQDSWTKPSAFCTMTMVDGANIVVAGGGAISVSAKVSAKMGYAGAPTSSYGHIAMQSGSSITVNSKGNLYAWGFISGDGNVTVKSGATVYESFQVVDWRGGTASSGMLGNNNKVFPMSQYYVQNVEVPMTLEAGSALTCSMIADIISVRVVAVQFLGSSGCIFNLTEGSAVKRYDGSTDRLILEINGKLSISPSEIELVPWLYSIDLADYVLPINNNVTLNVNSGATLTIAQDTSLLPGAQMNISEGGTVTLNSGKRLFAYDESEWKAKYYVYSNVYFRSVRYAVGMKYTRTDADIIDSKILVDGTLNASAGYLYTTASGANICSSKNGVVKLQAANSSHALYEAVQSGTDISYSSIPISAATLKHGDGTDHATGAGDYYYSQEHGRWVINGHTVTPSITIAATCNEKGERKHTCTCTYYTTEEIAALGHKEVIDAAVAPTCIETGLTEGCHCSVCNEVFTVQNVIPATGYHYWEVYSKNENDHTCQCKNCTDTVTLHVAYRLNDYLWFNGYVADGRFTGTNVISIQSSSGVKTAVSNGKRYFVKEIPADEIPNQLKFKVVSANNGEVTFTVSLEDYVVGSDKDALKSALLSYGEAAQKYFTGVTDVTAPTKPGFLNDRNTQVNEQQTLGNLSITTSGANIYFDEAIRLSVKYTLTAGENVVIDEENKTVTINGVSYNVVQVGVLLNEMGFADDNLTWKWNEVALTTANSMACLTFNTKTISAPDNYLPNRPDVPADPNNTNLNLPGDTVVNAFTASGEATFNLTAEQYLKGFSLRTFAVLEERNSEGNGTGVYHCIYGKQYGYGLEAYIKAMYGKADDAGKTYPAFDNLLYWTWNLAQVANGKNPLASGGNS